VFLWLDINVQSFVNAKTIVSRSCFIRSQSSNSNAFSPFSIDLRNAWYLSLISSFCEITP